MYLPAHFAEQRPDVLHALMREQPFATLVSTGAQGLAADHLPLRLVLDEGDKARLRGHVARANPVWRAAENTDVLAVFHGPQAYVSPSWYPSKREHGKAVPTWNYIVVHARGRLTAIDDPLRLRALLDDLVDHHEARLPQPWRIADAPPDYINTMLAAIVGIEVEITALEGKWKLSQNQPAANRAGVVAGLLEIGGANESAVAALLAAAPGAVTPR